MHKKVVIFSDYIYPLSYASIHPKCPDVIPEQPLMAEAFKRALQVLANVQISLKV